MTKLVGILNVSPDSFSDGNLYLEPKKAFEQAKKLFNDGASIVDVGAESTRPGATTLTPDQEWQRLQPILIDLIQHFPNKISVDTYHPQTAEKALKLGDAIINDVTGMNNPRMVEVIVSHNARCIISHLIGTDIQAVHRGELVDNLQTIKADLLSKVALLIGKKVPKEHIILDPGIGFGKTPELNRLLIEFAKEMPDYKVMIGYSRKRFLGDNRLEQAPNLEAGRAAIASGASYLRVHDVAGHRSLLY